MADERNCFCGMCKSADYPGCYPDCVPVIKCSACGGSVKRNEAVHCDGCTKHCVVCPPCSTGESCEQKEFQE